MYQQIMGLHVKKLCLFVFLCFFLYSFNCCAQGIPGYHPPMNNMIFPGGAPGKTTFESSSQKHHYKIVFADGSDTVVYTKIFADSPADYLLLENKSAGKKDSARHIKIYPSQTKYISHVDVTTGKEFAGQASDSCWLFKVIEGKMNAYTALGEISVDDMFIEYIQLGDGAMISVKDPKASDLFGQNGDAKDLFTRKKFYKAIKKYNKANG